MASDLSKQDYLKRYLEKDDKEKKRKKKLKTTKRIIPRLKILDKDIGIKSIPFGTKEEEEEDETPLVAEVFDERPVEVKLKEIYESSRWKKIGEDDSENTSVLCDPSDFTSTKKQTISKSGDVSSTHKKTLQHFEQSRSSRHIKLGNRHDINDDLSPVRVSRRHDSDSDYSPHQTPPRREKSPSLYSSHKSHQNHSDSDLSPERARRRKSPAGKSNRESDENPDSDLSPQRQRNRKLPPKNSRGGSDSDLSPPRENAVQSSATNSFSRDTNKRPVKTLSGLTAGLQNATTLREETKDLREREKALIRGLDADLSGRNAETVIRDRQTGLRRNVEEEMRIKELKEKKVSEQQQKYAEWGKGIEQTESKMARLSEDLHEISKPLARYCDDEDLEERLKSEIRDDDPMAQYMRKKKQKNTVAAYPVYTGPPPPPNRFNIPPGYRWDGVDRSNGFEKKYFEKKSSKRAVEEEAYLWSVQNM